jgi:hypothetical protein
MVHPTDISNIPLDAEENDLTFFRKHPRQMISSQNGDKNRFLAKTLARCVATSRPHGKAR